METTSPTTSLVDNLCLRCKCRPIHNKKRGLCASCVVCFGEKNSNHNGGLSVGTFIRMYPPAKFIQRKLGKNIVALRQPDRTSIVKFIAHSPKMQNLIQLIKQVAPTNTTVLLTGETGTGKELIANEIHLTSLRASGPFVIVDCTAFVDTLVESELFGYDKGAFTGAATSKPGLFESANGGTLFIDEISELPFGLQKKFLRVLETRHSKRLGSLIYHPINTRIVTATNRNLKELVDQNKFRADLYYRLSIVELDIPPLRERSEEIPSLLKHFMQEFGKQFDFEPSILELMMKYKWPGNVRELRNLVERFTVVSTSEKINATHLPMHFAKLALAV